MKIVMRKPTELIGAEYNPRELTDKQYRDLKDSLQRFGFVDPILVNKHKDRDNIIVGGHQRTRVAEDLGIKEVPTVEVNLTLDQEKELNIRLNKNSGQWDMEALANYFNEDDLVDWGFESWEFGLVDSDEPDYSVLDDEDLEDELGDLTDGVKKAIQIEFDLEHYEEAAELVKFWRDQDAYVGYMILEHLRAEKDKL